MIIGTTTHQVEWRQGVSLAAMAFCCSELAAHGRVGFERRVSRTFLAAIDGPCSGCDGCAARTNAAKHGGARHLKPLAVNTAALVKLTFGEPATVPADKNDVERIELLQGSQAA